MNCSPTLALRLRAFVPAVLVASGMLLISGAEAQMSCRPANVLPSPEEEEVPHPFFTHMGIPEGSGVWNLRSGALATRANGKTEGDFAFHLETGITERIGLHIRNDRFIGVPRTEVMFQFAALMSENGMSGFAPLIEFEVPTRSGGGDRINTLAGFTATLASARASFNTAVHYDPREDKTDNSAALVVALSCRVFPVVEVLTEFGRGMRPMANLLAGVKVRVREGLLLGVAYELPVMSNKEFSSQFVGQVDVEWRW